MGAAGLGSGPGTYPCTEVGWAGECPCMVRFNASWVLVTWDPLEDRHTRLKTLPSRNFVGGQ